MFQVAHYKRQEEPVRNKVTLSFPFTHLCTSGQRMNLQTIRCFTRAIRYGSKYIYQTLPRILTIWLDMAEEFAHVRDRDREVFIKINTEVNKAIKAAPAYKVRSQPDIILRRGPLLTNH